MTVFFSSSRDASMIESVRSLPSCHFPHIHAIRIFVVPFTFCVMNSSTIVLGVNVSDPYFSFQPKARRASCPIKNRVRPMMRHPTINFGEIFFFTVEK